MRKAARAIVIQDGKLLVMNRNKFGHQYYALVGGGVELNETPEQTVIREVQEETGLRITKARLVFIEEAGDPFGTQYIFLCEHVPGDPKLAEDSEEMAIHRLGKNLYEPGWLPIDQLPEAPFLSETLQVALVYALHHGFPNEPIVLDPGTYHKSVIQRS
jgi:8-oxo-dGTP pyrophosphatase MutT (NUDIX family)